jgi:hypothetical protein
MNFLFQVFLLIYNMMQTTSGLVKTTQAFGALAAIIYAKTAEQEVLSYLLTEANKASRKR